MAIITYGEDKMGAGKAVKDEAKKLKTAQQNIKDATMARAGALTPQASSAKNPPVYLGQGPPGVWSPTFGSEGSPPITQNLDAVAQDFYSWNQNTKDKFLSQLALAGYDTEGMKDAQAAQLWGSYAEQAAKYWNNGSGAKMTPWDVLAMDMKQREKYLNTPRTVTNTSTSFNLSTEGDARAIFMQAAQSLLGRDPTASETKTFQAALNAMERANPTVTTQTQNFIGDTLQSQQSTSTGGVGEGAKTVLAMDDIKKDPEYGAYQAATNGMNWLMEAVNAGG